MDLIELRDIHKTYYLGEVDLPVLKGVSLNVARGELVALMGASGSGKSTLMNILGCLDHPTSGEYWLDGQEISRLTAKERARLRNRIIGFVFQSFNLLPRTTALENVLMPLTYTKENLSDSQMKQRAAELLRKVGLADRIDHQPSQLSGGEQQRVAIARSLVNQPQRAPGRRADRQPRFTHQRGNPPDVPAVQQRRRHHDHPCHPRSRKWHNTPSGSFTSRTA